MKDKFIKLKFDLLKQKDVFISAMFIGLLSHTYMFFNKLPGYDDYVSIFHYGSGYSSGRWLLGLIGNFMFRIDGVYSLPWLNGFFSLFLLSLSISLFLRPFHFDNKWIKRLFAALFISFPTLTSTMAFMFTIPFYSIAIFLLAIAFSLLIDYKYGYILSIFLVAFSMGIYQAYWCIIASFLLVYLISLCINNNADNIKIIYLSIKSFVVLLLGVIVYLLINKVILKWQGINLSSYQGLNETGTFNVSNIPSILSESYGWFFKFTTENYQHITWYPIIRKIILLAYIISFIGLIIHCIYLRKKPLKLTALIGFTFFLPLTVNSIYIMCNNSSNVHLLMCYSVVVIFILPFVYFSNIEIKLSKITIASLLKTIYMLGLIIVICLYVRLANLFYLNLDLSYKETTSFMTTLSTRIQQTEGYTTDKLVYFHGIYPNEHNRTIWELRAVNTMHGGVDIREVVNTKMLRKNYFRIYSSVTFNELEDPNIISDLQEYLSHMSCYPNDNSIKVFDNYIIVKFSE